jgi:hypothetical protein
MRVSSQPHALVAFFLQEGRATGSHCTGRSVGQPAFPNVLQNKTILLLLPGFEPCYYPARNLDPWSGRLKIFTPSTVFTVLLLWFPDDSRRFRGSSTSSSVHNGDESKEGGKTEDEDAEQSRTKYFACESYEVSAAT